MTQYKKLTQEEIENVLDVFWVLLGNCEHNAEGILEKNDVEAGYRVWNNVSAHDNNLKPYWSKQ